jgi:ribosomal protein S4
LYKTIIKRRENIENKTKLLKFKKKKWKKAAAFYLKGIRWYKRYKAQDQSRYIMTRYARKGNSFEKLFRNNLNNTKKLRLFYGGLSRKELKKYIKTFLLTKTKKTMHKNLLFLQLLERRLDTVLYRAKFARNFRNARQLISHKKVFVNNKIVNSPAYRLKQGDLITFNLNIKNVVESNLKYCLFNWIRYKSRLWPIPPKHLIINYKTMEIIIDNIDLVNLSTDFKNSLHLEHILTSYYRY